MSKYIIGILVGIIIALLVLWQVQTKKLRTQLSSCQDVITQIENNPITKIDTVYDTVTVETPVLVPITHTDSVTDTITKLVDYKKLYQGADTTGDGILYYKLQTRGDLLWHQYKFRYTKPIITNEKIVLVDNIVQVKQKLNLYTFIETGITEHQFSVGALGSYNRIGIIYRYDLTHQSHNAGVTYKIR